MTTISFEEYCEDFLDQDPSLMSAKEYAEAKASYAEFIKPKSVKAQKQALFDAKKDDEVAMLAHHNITKEIFDAVTHEDLARIRTSKEAVGFKDPKRQLWHDYRVALQKTINAQFKSTKSRSKKEQSALDRAKAKRTEAKALGGKALTGTPKQKAWAEEIRKNFLNLATPEQADIFLASSLASTSKFWIEVRYCTAQEIIDCILGKTKYELLVKKTVNKAAEAKRQRFLK